MTTTTTAQNEYTEAGFPSRRAYLESLADDYGIPTSTVFTLASILGRGEDFDGLIAALEDEADRLATVEEVA